MKEKIRKLSGQINYGLTLLLFFSMPFGFKPLRILLPLWVLSGLVCFSKKYWIALTRKEKAVYLVFPVYLLINILSLLYTQDANVASARLERLIPFAVVPLVFVGMKEKYENVWPIVSAFIIGLLCASIQPLYKAISMYMGYDVTKYFFYNYFDTHIQGVYYAFQLVIANVFIFYYLKENYFSIKKRWRLLLVFLVAFFSLLVIFISSKAGVLSLALVVGVFAFQLFVQQAKKFRYIWLLFTILLIGGVVLIIPRTRHLITTLVNQGEYSFSNSTNVRLQQWQVGFKLIGHKPVLGYGIGDSQSHIEAIVLSETGEIWENVNSHNMYITTYLDAGVLALLGLLLILILPFTIYKGRLNYYMINFLLITGFNLLFESMFIKSIGVMLIVFFYYLFINFNIPKEKTI